MHTVFFFCFVLSFLSHSFVVVLAFQWPLFMLKTFSHKQGPRRTNSTFSIKEQGTATVVKALSSYQCGLGLIPRFGAIRGLSLLMIPILVPRGFSSCTLVFPSPRKPTFPNSNSIWITDVHFIMSLCPCLEGHILVLRGKKRFHPISSSIHSQVLILP